jgi:opacity protein-like surface antigen
MKKFLITSLCALLGSLAVFAQVPTTPSVPSVNKGKYTDYTIQESGFWWGGELLGGVLANELSVYGPIQAQVIAGYRFNEFFQLGGGVGVRYYINNLYRKSRSGIAVPLFLDLRGLMISGEYRSVVPCWSLDVGYTFNDGVMFSPMIGLRFGDEERHHFILGIAYMGQHSVFNVEGILLKGFLHGAMLKLAYEF